MPTVVFLNWIGKFQNFLCALVWYGVVSQNSGRYPCIKLYCIWTLISLSLSLSLSLSHKIVSKSPPFFVARDNMSCAGHNSPPKNVCVSYKYLPLTYLSFCSFSSSCFCRLWKFVWDTDSCIYLNDPSNCDWCKRTKRFLHHANSGYEL